MAFVAKDEVLHTPEGQFDLHSGKEIAATKLPGAGCGPATMAGDLYVSAFGACVREDLLLRSNDLKPDCTTGVVLSDGIGLSPAGSCSCPLEIRGYRAFASAQDLDPHGAGDTSTRFVRGPAFDRPAGNGPPARFCMLTPARR